MDDKSDDFLDNQIGIEHLEKLIKEEGIVSYEPECVRKKSNWSKKSNKYLFDKQEFDPEELLKDIPTHSPKLNSLLKKIEFLDKRDQRKYGKKFKHFIFSDLKSGTYGVKLLASALIAKGMKLGYSAKLKKNAKKPIIEEKVESSDEEISDSDDSDEEEGDNIELISLQKTNKNQKGGDGSPKPKNEKNYEKIELFSHDVLKKHRQNNFYMLSSVAVYDQPISVAMKKSVLQTFNSRPDNIYGDLARIIILDSGFKEGIDLFDIKYIHIFEPSVVGADQKQVIGRGTRTCGQKGLDFHPTRGWPLYVFVYDLELPEAIRSQFLDTKTAFDLYIKAMNLDIRLFHFSHDLEKTTIVGSVDYELNKNVHTFSVPNEDGDEGDEGEFIYGGKKQKEMEQMAAFSIGGGPKVQPKYRLKIRNGESIVAFPPPEAKMGHLEMRKHIREHFNEFEWPPVKMENLCDPKQSGGSGEVIKYTPTQDFVQHYFTPNNPIKGMLLFHSVGTGKCHAKNTPILMYDGTIKMVQDIRLGEYLMGDNSTPRKVLSLANGRDQMYDIIPTKGEKYTVNSEHILCLKYNGRRSVTNLSKSQPNLPFKTFYLDNKSIKIKSKSFKTIEEADAYLDSFKEEDKIVEIEVKDYLKLPINLARQLNGYSKGVEFKSSPIEFDPYIIGIWLGDGSKRGPIITTQDSRILYYLRNKVREYGLRVVYQSKYDYRISSDCTKKTNAMIDILEKYNLINNKHIPLIYKCNDRNRRLELLAGIIDSEGYYCKRGKCYSINEKNDILANDILFLVKSLGFAGYLHRTEKSCIYKGERKVVFYNTISISGNGLEEIPTKLLRKKADKREKVKDTLTTGITISPVGEGDYYGFTLDGNNRYLLGDFTVTHNTCSAIAAATNTFERENYTILWVTRTTLKNDIWKNMFDQVCNESIRNKIQNSGLEIPNEQNKRMRLLSKSWKIRPMSYKQFSNLVSKQNNLYKDLVKINGEVDPLRKTLLIIDEAHKLYGGGDLSSIERPDMVALHHALMHSYQISGQDSVKLLLMTATPITQNPLELIQLLNLCKTYDEQMPTNFDDFSGQYLNEQGQFTDNGRDKYLDDIAGYVSYLNREKDARQFSQPQVQIINTPIVNDLEDIKKYDKKIVKSMKAADVSNLKSQILEKQNSLKGELGDLDPNKFNFLKDECEGLEGKPLKSCERVVKANIRDLVNEAKEEVKKIREEIKEIKELMKERNGIKKDALKEIRENQQENPEEYEKYKETALFMLKNKCAIKVSSRSNLLDIVDEHPIIQKFNRSIEKNTEKINQLQERLKEDMLSYKKRMDYLRKLSKMNLNELENNVVKMTMKEERATNLKILKIKKKDTKKNEKEYKSLIKVSQKSRKKYIAKIRKTIKKKISNEKKALNAQQRDEKKLRKTMRKQGKVDEDIKNEFIHGLVNKYKAKILEDLVNIDEVELESKNQKEQQKQDRQEEKKRKKAEKEHEKKTKKAEKEHEKQTKKEEKEKIRKTKKEEKEKIRKTKKQK